MRVDVVLAGLALAACVGIPGARGEATIAGTPEHVRVTAQNATLGELLSSFRDKFGLSYRSAIALDQTVDGTYRGTLASVLKRLLVRYDYVLKSEMNEDSDTLVLAVIDMSSSAGQLGPLASLVAVAPQSNGEGNIVAGQWNGRPPVRAQTGLGGLLQTQAKLLATARPGVLAASPTAGSLQQTPGGMPMQAAIAELTQRAAVNVQSLTQALRALPVSR